MEDENWIELSLGLSCGSSAGKSKGKDGSFSDVKTEEGGSNCKSISDLKNFLNTGIQKQDSIDLPQNTDPAHSGIQTLQENFFTNLTKSAPAVDASTDFQKNNSLESDRHGGLWIANNKSAEVEEIKSNNNDIGGKMWSDAGNKRKMLFEEINDLKKHEREAQHTDGHGKNPYVGVVASVKTSHVSVTTTEDGSTAENEDVIESEVEGSTSRLVLHHEEATKRYLGGGISSNATLENHEKKQSNAQLGNEHKHGNLTYGTTLPVMSLPSKMPNATVELDASVFPIASMMQFRPPVNNEGSGAPVNPGNMPLTFGYSPVQLPTLDTGSLWGLISHPQQLPSSFAGRSIGSVVPSLDNSEDGVKISRAIVQAPPHSSSEALHGRKASDLLKGGGKQHGGEDTGPSSSSQTEDEVKGNRLNLAVDGFTHESAVIRPGIAPSVKFGGCGSYPDLPWVSTTAPGPNGRTISGVTYRYDNNQIKIVCACHGSHMSQEEFVQHASADPQSSENNVALASFPNGNPATSTHS